MSKFNFFLITLLFTNLSVFSTNDNEPVLLKSASTNPVDIPFEKWQFPNGLKVLIHEDNSDPLVHVHVTYHVGSNRETAGKSGFAHFFEHMMFQNQIIRKMKMKIRLIYFQIYKYQINSFIIH